MLTYNHKIFNISNKMHDKIFDINTLFLFRITMKIASCYPHYVMFYIMKCIKLYVANVFYSLSQT